MKLLESDFRSLHLSNLKPLPTISFYTTHAQADSQYIRPTCCQGSTSTQSKFFAYDIIVHYIRTT